MRIELYNINYLNVVELNISGNKQYFIPGDAESKFLDTEVFNLFAHCFERSHPLFDYNEPTRYTSRQIVTLMNSLKRELDQLQKIENAGSLIEWIGQRFLGSGFIELLHQENPEWIKSWQAIRDQLTGVVSSLIGLIDRCIAEEKILWVKGY